MKKKLLLLAAVVISLAAVCLFAATSSTTQSLALFQSNVEALMSVETDNYVCYSDIKTHDGLYVRYCGNCKIIPGTKAFLATQDSCK